MKTIEVVAAVIKNNNKVFATRRGYGDFENMWEFPGGKVEAGESWEGALRREIMEELDVQIIIDQFLTTIEYDYPQFHLTMHCFLCTLGKGTLHLKEHNDSQWVTKETIDKLGWLPADLDIIELVKEII